MLKEYNIFLKAVTIYLISILVLLVISLFMNDGHFVYVLDDPYIHMTIARNFTVEGHWATNGHGFTSATSSPLWTLLLSGVTFISGSVVWIPFILNIIFGLLAIYAANYFLRQFNINKYRLLILLVFVYVTAFPAILFTGMEHTAQIMASLLFLFLSSRLIVNNKNSLKEIILLLFLSLFISGIRYEGAFLVFTAAVIFFIRKKYFIGLLLLLSCALPIVIYGLISEANGWMFLPNTLLVKSILPEYSLTGIARIFFRALKSIIFEPPLLFLFAAALMLLKSNAKLNKDFWTQKQTLLIIFVLTTILHMVFAQTGWFYRYEAYLVGMGILAVTTNIYDYLPDITAYKSNWKTIAFTLVVLSFAYRSFSAFLVPQSSYNIYEQHFQMGKFVSQYCAGINIAANDIGMINYYSNNKITDLWGLANLEVAKDKINKSYTTDRINDIAVKNNVKLVMAYKDWFYYYGGLPADWIKIGEWTMTELNIVCGSVTVDFFVLKKEDAESLKEKLKEFSKTLPESVVYKIY